MSWTPSQEQVIKLHQRDILVSAAAGSGKTAVLVARIIAMVTDETHPVDIDHILVVTFTKAAAKEMKERIYDAIAKALKEHPDNHHLQRQMTLIHHAPISTIDSFCNALVRQHFGEIDLDPQFRISDPGEQQLLEANTWDEVLEANYEAAEDDFLHLVNCYASGDRDDALVESLQNIYVMSLAYPWPKEWLHQLETPYAVADTEELMQTDWMRDTWQRMQDILQTARTQAQGLLHDLRACAGDETHPYEANVLGDMGIIDHLLEGADWKGLFAQAASMPDFSRLSTKKFERQTPEEKEDFKNRRNAIKDAIHKMKETYLAKDLDAILLEMQELRPIVAEMVRLVEQFQDAMAEKKRRLGVYDFADMEHFALDILVDQNTKELRPVAQELAAYYEEVMVDEYQDSNHLQETILHSISKESLGYHNYFMVGDVKQSIYRFRQAEPQIFNDKYRAFSAEESLQQRIDLDKNFRSRENIVETVNDVFRYIMKPDMGGVDYDEAASLKCGATYPATTSNLATEIRLVQRDDPLFDEEEISGEEAEFVMIAQRINELMTSGMEVYDKKLDRMRPLQYRDVAVLRRGLSSGVGERLVEVLEAYQIPAHLNSSTGYFNTLEVEVVLSFLMILANPRQDVPLVAVLRSPLVGLSDEDLAAIRVEYPKGSYHEAVFAYAENHEEDAKLAHFLELYETMRNLTVDTPIHRVIQIFYEVSGYLQYVSALPGGDVRAANLQKLVDLAITFESTSFRGLFHFVHYIEKLKKYEKDFGEADLVSEEDNAIRVMTIHKSKGLEFPVVVLSGVTRGFNHTDSRGGVLLHANLGIGINRIDPTRRLKEKSFYHEVLAEAIDLDMLGEELRVLYVALTRAREKLLLTGTVKSSAVEKLEERVVGFGESFQQRRKAGCYLDWIYPAILHHPGKYPVTMVDAAHLVAGATVQQVLADVDRQALLGRCATADATRVSELAAGFVHTYSHPRQQGFKNKYSVSELKHAAIEAAMADGLLPEHGDGEDKALFGTEAKKHLVPAFLSGEATDAVYVGALRGTAMHRYLECFDFVRPGAPDTYEEQLGEMKASGRLTAEQEALLREGALKRFLRSDLAGRMMNAAVQGNLYKERAFVMGDAPSAFFPEASADGDGQMVLVQGIIDVFFKEEDGIVLLDYKTDRIDSAEELVVRYAAQMKLYADAIMRTQGMPVKEMYLYSFALGETIPVE